MSSGGGGGQSGVTRYDWKPTMEGYWGESALPWAGEEASRAYTPYYGNRVAGQNNDIWTAIQRTRDMGDAGGPADTKAGRATAGDIAAGNKLGSNPYGGMSSPYFDAMMQQGMGDITNAYKTGTAADTTRMFNLSGAFGGSAHQNAVANK